MNKDDALLIADKILALINSQPRTPSREEIAAAVETAIPPKTMAYHLGSTLESFLVEEGELEAATLKAVKTVIAWQISQEILRG